MKDWYFCSALCFKFLIPLHFNFVRVYFCCLAKAMNPTMFTHIILTENMVNFSFRQKQWRHQNILICFNARRRTRDVKVWNGENRDEGDVKGREKLIIKNINFSHKKERVNIHLLNYNISIWERYWYIIQACMFFNIISKYLKVFQHHWSIFPQ